MKRSIRFFSLNLCNYFVHSSSIQFMSCIARCSFCNLRFQWMVSAEFELIRLLAHFGIDQGFHLCFLCGYDAKKNYCDRLFSQIGQHQILSGDLRPHCYSCNDDCCFWNPCCDENSTWQHSSSQTEKTHFVARGSHLKATFDDNLRGFIAPPAFELAVVSKSFIAIHQHIHPNYLSILICAAGWINLIEHMNFGSTEEIETLNYLARTFSNTDWGRSEKTH